MSRALGDQWLREGAPRASGSSGPPYYRTTPGAKNNTLFLPQAEVLGEDKMWISFRRHLPFPPSCESAGPFAGGW
jgi:hypothetical protein